MKQSRHRARWVLVEPDVWLENGFVDVSAHVITAVGRARPGDDGLDHGPGVILPALVNAHTHLSLSALAGKIDTSRGFINWVHELIHARAALSGKETLNAALTAAGSARDAGTGLVAEVGPVEPGATALRTACLDGTVFAEVLGQNPELPDIPDSVDGLGFSYAGHALHTTSPGLLQKLRAASARKGRFSLHLAESDAEVEFLATGKGAWAEFLETRGIASGDWGPWGESAVARAHRLNLLGRGTLVVHVLHADLTDLEILARTGTSVCVCPRSNWELHGRLPAISSFLRAGLTCALGTDSLASCPTLSMFDEMAFVAERFPELSPRTILSLATAHGAEVLARSDLGSLKTGNRASLLYVDLVADSAEQAAFNLVSGRFGRVEWL